MPEVDVRTPSPETTHDPLGAAWLRVNAIQFDWNTPDDQQAWRHLLETTRRFAASSSIREQCEALHVDPIDLASAIVEELAVGLTGAHRVGGGLTRDFGEHAHAPRGRRDRERWCAKMLNELHSSLKSASVDAVLKQVAKCGFYGVEWSHVAERCAASGRNIDNERLQRAWWGTPNGRGRASANQRSVRQALFSAMRNELKTLRYEDTSFPEHASIDKLVARVDSDEDFDGGLLDALDEHDFFVQIQGREQALNALLERAVREVLPSALGCPAEDAAERETPWWSPARETRVSSAVLELLALEDLEVWTREPAHLQLLAQFSAHLDPRKRPAAKHAERLSRQARRGRAQLEAMLVERLSDLAAHAEASLTRESRSFERLCGAARHHLILCDDPLFGDTPTLTLPLPPTDPRTATIYGARYILYVETSLRLFYVRDRTGLKDRVAALFQRHSAAF